MQIKRWCVHFSDGTRLEVEAGYHWLTDENAVVWSTHSPNDIGSQKNKTVLHAAPGEWRYFHAVGEDGCGAVDSAKEKMTAKGKTPVGQEGKS